MQLAVRAISQVFHVLDSLLVLANDSGGSEELVRDLEVSLIAAMASHRMAYPNTTLAPKWHKGLHIAGQILKRHRAWSAFTLERKHKIYKEFAAKVNNMLRFEKTVTLSLLNHQVNTFNDEANQVFAIGTFLINPSMTVSGDSLGFAGDVAISKAAFHNMIHSAAGDFVFHKSSVCSQGALNVSRVEGRLFTEAGHFTLTRPCTEYSPGCWKEGESYALIALTNVLGPGIWTQEALGFRVLLPPRLQHMQAGM